MWSKIYLFLDFWFFYRIKWINCEIVAVKLSCTDLFIVAQLKNICYRIYYYMLIFISFIYLFGLFSVKTLKMNPQSSYMSYANFGQNAQAGFPYSKYTIILHVPYKLKTMEINRHIVTALPNRKIPYLYEANKHVKHWIKKHFCYGISKHFFHKEIQRHTF